MDRNGGRGARTPADPRTTVIGCAGSVGRLGAAMAAACLALAACADAPFTQVSDTPAAAYEASLAPVSDGFIAAWYDTRHGHGELYARRLDADGRPVAPEHRLTVGEVDAYEADVAPLRDGFAVAWYEKSGDGRLVPKLGAWNIDGTPRWRQTLSAQGRNTIVRTLGGLVFAAWIEDEGDDRAGVWATWRRFDDADLITPRRIADAGRTTWNLNAAIDPEATPGRPLAWVVFDAIAGTRNEEIFLAATGESADRVVRLTPDDGAASKYPDIAIGPDRTALTWFDLRDGNEEVYLAVGHRPQFDGAIGRFEPRRVTSTPGHSIGAYVVWNGERLGLAWCDDTPGNQELFFAPFDREGHPAGAPTRLTRTAAASSIPSIRPSRNGFALLWNEREAGSETGAHGGDARSQVMFTVVP